MHETQSDLEALQTLVDATYRAAGSHLRTIHTEDRRLDARGICEVLSGVCILNLATANRDGAPVVAPVDGLFLRGRFWFGSAPTSLRFRHIRREPRVSAAFTVGESISIVVHGVAHEIDTSTGRFQELFEYCEEVYGEKFTSWDYWGKNPYAWIEAKRFYAIQVDS